MTRPTPSELHLDSVIMAGVKNVALIFLWAILTYRVCTMIFSANFGGLDLIVLTWFVWLGCIVLEQTYMYARQNYTFFDARDYRYQSNYSFYPRE